MTERALGWWVMASVALHMVGVAAGSLGRPSMDITPGTAVAIEVVRVPAPEPPPTPPPPPRVKTVLPRIVQRAPEPKPVEAPPLMTPNLLDSPAPPAATPPRVDSTLVPSALPSVSAPVVGAPAGAGALFASGDLLVTPGSSGSAGSGAAGPRGQGLASAGVSSSQVAATGTGLTSLAQPLGGYQVKPDYPSARARTAPRARRCSGSRCWPTGAWATSSWPSRPDGGISTGPPSRPSSNGSSSRPAADPPPVAVWATLPVRFVLNDR